jgi:hypothetical protein
MGHYNDTSIEIEFRGEKITVSKEDAHIFELITKREAKVKQVVKEPKKDK